MQRDPPSRRRHGQPLIQFLETDPALAQFSAHAKKLLKLQYLFERAVPAALAPHGRVANFRLGKVVIHAGSGAVAAKIRQLGPRLADVFRQAGVQVSEIQIKVQPDPTAPPVQRRPAASVLEERTRLGLGRLQASLPADSPLTCALRRFLERA